MIDFLVGSVEDINEKGIVLLASSVGYALSCSTSTINDLTEKKENVKVYSYLSVSDNGLALYGFSAKKEREMFLKLISVSKVGPKAALSILSCFSVEQLSSVITSSDVKALTRAVGVGKKMAESIIFALKDSFSDNDTYVISSASEIYHDDRQEAIWALNSLGFDNSYAVMLIDAVYAPDMSCEEIIKEALKISNK